MPRYDFPDLDAEQQRLIGLLNDTWQAQRAWPTFDFVAARLGLQGPQAAELLRSFPTVGGSQPLGMTYGDVAFERSFPAPPDESKVRLTARGLARDRRGEDTAIAFVHVLSVAASKCRNTPDSPHEVKQVEVTAEEVLQGAAGIAADDLLSVGDLLAAEPFRGRLSTSADPAGRWSLRVGRGVTRYLGMGVEDYLASVDTDLAEHSVREPVAYTSASQPAASLIGMTQPTPADKVFISHAGADRAVGVLIKQTLQLSGVPADRIFYSSARDTGIPTGVGLRARLQQELAAAALVIELLTPTFFKRPMCLMEVGGAWALGKATYPIVVPPTTLAEAQAVLGDVIMGQLTSESLIEDTFAELHDQVATSLGLRLPSSAWNESLRNLRAGLPGALNEVRESQPHASNERDGAQQGIRTGAEPLLITDTRAVDGLGGGVKILGRISNNTGRVLSTVVLKAVFYRNAVMVDTADGFVQQLPSQQTKTFTIDSRLGADQFDSVAVEVDQYV